jgi:chromate transporter
VNPILLYFLLLKASFASLNGMASLPMVRQDFVVHRQLITDQQLSTAVVAARTGPGPYGIYMVCVAYLVGGVPGAVAGLLAMVTPSFLVIGLMKWMSTRADLPRVRSAIRALMLASAGLLFYSSVPLARETIAGPFTAVVAGTCFVILSFTRLQTAWLIFTAAAAGLLVQALAGGR